MTKSVLPIYKRIVCLEVYTPQGRNWWDQGYDLGYSPFRIDRITKIRHGRLKDSNRIVLAIWADPHGWVAINPARSDIKGMKNINAWPDDIPKPFTEFVKYKVWPENLL